LRYLFEEFAFDTERRELYRGTDTLSVAPQVFDILDYLIRNRERVVSKDELVKAIWNGRIVSEVALTTRLNAARSAIGDSGSEQRLIKTLPRKGFRFVGQVQEAQMPGSAASANNRIEPVVAALPGHAPITINSPPRLSIVVLPFINLGGGAEQDHFVDGLTESLTTDLSRIAGSFVIARNTAFTLKGKTIDVRKLGGELNVRYVLEGSVQRGGNRLRVNVQLIDVETGNHLWAERFDKTITDLFDMQDEIVSRLANTLNAQFVEAEAQRAERSPHPDAMDLYFRGRVHINKGITPEYMAQASGFFDRALTLDPGNIEAMVGLAQANIAIGASFFTDDRTGYLEAAEHGLIKVLNMAPQHARAHLLLGVVQNLTNRAAQGIAECERALALDRNLADAHAMIGLAKVYIGRSEETEVHINEALRLSPRDTFSFRWLYFRALAKLQLGADGEGITWLRRSIETNRGYPLAHFHLAAALALTGQLDQARAAAQAGLALEPTFTIRRFRLNASSDNPVFLARRRRLYEGMGMAGVPEE
jgi:TolB-like protein/DNA-binding winged helix-turn-helix (wHTH) protein/tetratricopeptide (TPR) repeat protein